MAEVETATVKEIWGGIFASICARALPAFVLIFAFTLGLFVGGVGLHDPDTCWLLGLGRYIFEHHALPSTDPFSYSFALEPGRPFVMYQWLSELLFFCAYKLAALPALLMFAALILGQAFLVFPLRLAAKRMPMSVAIALTILGACAAGLVHFLVRPEIISYFCMGILLTLMQKVYLEEESTKMDWRLVAAFFVLMLFWANVHSAFALAFGLQLLAIICGVIELVVKKGKLESLTTALGCLVSSSLAPLVNPFGFGLLAYLPGLFWAKFNPGIAELRPVGIAQLRDFTFWPFFLLIIICLIILGRGIGCAIRTKAQWRYYNLVVIIGSIFVGLSCRRMIPFAVLVMIVQCSELWWQAKSVDANVFRFGDDFEKKLRGIFDPSTYLWAITVAVLGLVGAFFTISKMPEQVVIPQSSTAFKAPMKAIDFLRTHVPEGRVLNDAQLGDVLIWYLPDVRVFIDTRYDMYGEKLVADYLSMIACKGEWRQLLNKYDIRWVFVPPKSEIAKQLSGDPNWTTIFADAKAEPSAVILLRR